MPRGVTPTESKPQPGADPPSARADWSRGPVAGAIALVLLIAAAAMLPIAMRLGPSATPEFEIATPPRGMIDVTRNPAPAGPSPVLAMNRPAAPIPAPMAAPDAPNQPEEPASTGESGGADGPMSPITPEPATTDPSPPVPPPASDEPNDEPEPEPEPEPVNQQAGLLIDLNTAGAAELELLPGIGPAMAARIIEDRTANGPFPSLEALDRVRGIGPRTIENLRGKATVSGAAPAGATGTAQPGPAVPAAKVPINIATAEELDTLPGIGPALAARIIEDRAANGPFRTIDDLQRVRGIGPKTIERLRPLITARIPTDRR